MFSVRRVLLLFLLSGAFGQEFASDCPEPNGYFADAVQCDKYYACKKGVLTEKLCPDGMVFNDLNPRVENCDYPFQISCEGRPELQPAQASKNCPRLHGYFPHENEKTCNEFYYCAAGTGSHITCPEGLVFSLKTGTCGWPDEAGRVGCTSQNVLNFTCPKVSFDVAVAHPRYSDPDDCQFFYVCINGDTPRRNGCKFGQVFNNATKACDQPVNVPDCKEYYKEYFEEYFATLGQGSSIPTPDILAAAIGSGFALPDKPKRVKISSDSLPSRRRKPIDDTVAADTAVVEADANLPIRRRLTAEEISAADSIREEPAQRRPLNRPNQPLEGDPVRRPLRRRRPNAKTTTSTTTTTTTTTTTAAPGAADDYYYYDYPEGEAPPAGDAAGAPKP